MNQTRLQHDILLCALNSTYQHAAFGLRYLFANLTPVLREKTRILEWTIKENPRQIVEEILKAKPKIVGFGVYIWNTDEVLQVISILKSVAPHVTIVLGGPEISHETEGHPHLKFADYVITGESDFSFREFCTDFFSGLKPSTQVIRSPLPDIKLIQLPYDLYTTEDITNRLIYVEASRGCPYKCEYCLSSLDKSVRNFDLQQFLDAMKQLLDRGARTFKFVDRTFNLSPTTSTQILKFFLEHKDLGLFLHFEMVPDRLPTEIKDLITQFPEGSLQFEIGLQTLNPVVAAAVSRKNDLIKVAENLKFLKEHTKIHSHTDLIVGLPGETLESFSKGFDQLAEMHPDEIQVGVLKRLKGTPITRKEKEAEYQMVYQTFAPFQILSNSTMTYDELQRMNRFAKFWDLYANSGEFKNLVTHLKQKEGSFFWNFMALVDFVSLTFKETHSISLMSLAEQAWKFLLVENALNADHIITQDYCYGFKRRDLPPFLKSSASVINKPKKENSLKQRQLRHQD